MLSLFFKSLKRYLPSAVHYITDTEGHYLSFQASILRSHVVKFGMNGRLEFKENQKNPYFIFGGDLTDRGPNDTMLTALLLDFKQRHPEEVILIVGNREASKTRLYVELNPIHIRQRLLKGEAPHWLQSKPHQVPLDYVKKHMATLVGIPNFDYLEKYVNTLNIKDCQLIYLKWMLEQTMNCPHTFSFHAQSLAEQRQCSLENITEHDVLDSLMTINSPSGLMGQYLRETQLGVIIPNSGIIAVHGGLTAENIGRLPSMELTDPIIEDARSWMDQCNQWYKKQVMAWSELVQSDLPLQLKPARLPLDVFSEFVPFRFRSPVIASCATDDKQRFMKIPQVVGNYLVKNHLNIVLTGHQPCGDFPAVIRNEDDSVLCVMGDTGYSSNQNSRDTRKDVAHALQIFGTYDQAEMVINARISNSQEVGCTYTIKQGKIHDNSPVGKMLPNYELIQCEVVDGSYRTVYKEGFEVKYNLRSLKEILQMLKLAHPLDEPKISKMEARHAVFEATAVLETVMVVGGSRGIGLGFVEHYLKKGCHVVATHRDNHTWSGLSQLKRQYPVTLQLCQLDVTDESVGVSLARHIKKNINVLILNAGVILSKSGAKPTDETAENMKRSMDVNAHGPDNIIRALFSKLLVPNSCVVYISSTLSSPAQNIKGGYHTYRASKAAGNIIMQNWNGELARYWMEEGGCLTDRPCAFPISPGLVKTDMSGGSGELTVEESVCAMDKVINKVRETKEVALYLYNGDILESYPQPLVVTLAQKISSIEKIC